MKIFKSKQQKLEEKAKRDIETAKLKTRTPVEIGNEYTKLCGELGDKQYRKTALETEITQISNILYRLNQEYHKAVQLHGPPQPVQAPAQEQVKNDAPQSV